MSGFVNPLGRSRPPGYAQAIERLKTATRRLLSLSDDAVVSVTELACPDPGCPDIETVVAILIAGERPRTARFQKRIPEVDPSDLAAAFGIAGA
jgi:hypothetical protein